LQPLPPQHGWSTPPHAMQLPPEHVEPGPQPPLSEQPPEPSQLAVMQSMSLHE
jgi:hypothetical protein